MGERTGVQNVNSLVGMMVQSDRMGTSISQALRVHSAFLRIQRAQKAEEMAAKLPVKIMFPMLLFIFPAVFIVVLGPAVIHIMQSSFFKRRLVVDREGRRSAGAAERGGWSRQRHVSGRVCGFPASGPAAGLPAGRNFLILALISDNHRKASSISGPE